VEIEILLSPEFIKAECQKRPAFYFKKSIKFAGRSGGLPCGQRSRALPALSLSNVSRDLTHLSQFLTLKDTQMAREEIFNQNRIYPHTKTGESENLFTPFATTA
jgi:hypothetical protein